MLRGHYGVSFGLKAAKKTIPLWVLFLAVQWIDVMWATFVLLGIEKVEIVPGYTKLSPVKLYYMPGIALRSGSGCGIILWPVHCWKRECCSAGFSSI